MRKRAENKETGERKGASWTERDTDAEESREQRDKSPSIIHWKRNSMEETAKPGIENQ
jgi:hypothetical protein